MLRARPYMQLVLRDSAKHRESARACTSALGTYLRKVIHVQLNIHLGDCLLAITKWYRALSV
jgi:hypothetical protein